MQKIMILLLATLCVALSAKSPDPVLNTGYTISRVIFETENLPFLENAGPGAFDSYLIMNLPFSPVKKLYLDLKESTGLPLKSRGEAHITIVTPIEYYEVLRKHISIIEINGIAKDLEIQTATFEVVCLGKGAMELSGKLESVFFIVLKSPALVKIRAAIQKKFIENGGSPGSFDPAHFYPHITVGFTLRDMHEADGVIKDESSFFETLQIE
ncbi:MAG: hypothetical protein PHW04_18565 [Candidatus Wallbacteria bacterium]|nr:hypothetical protein [Candidatus Wallbacteria bacterium]